MPYDWEIGHGAKVVCDGNGGVQVQDNMPVTSRDEHGLTWVLNQFQLEISQRKTFQVRGRSQSRRIVITIFTQIVPKFQNQATITAGRDCGLAEWIIDPVLYLTTFIFINI